jgi:hypothetical protein
MSDAVTIDLASRLFREQAWSRWMDGATDNELREGLAALFCKLGLDDVQIPLWLSFVHKLHQSLHAAAAPDPGDGWDTSKSAALDFFLRLEIAAGRFLGAIEDARSAFARLYAVLTPTQQHILDRTFGQALAR